MNNDLGLDWVLHPEIPIRHLRGKRDCEICLAEVIAGESLGTAPTNLPVREAPENTPAMRPRGGVRKSLSEISTEQDALKACDHVGTRRIKRIDASGPSLLCARCNSDVG